MNGDTSEALKAKILSGDVHRYDFRSFRGNREAIAETIISIICPEIDASKKAALLVAMGALADCAWEDGCDAGLYSDE